VVYQFLQELFSIFNECFEYVISLCGSQLYFIYFLGEDNARASSNATRRVRFAPDFTGWLHLKPCRVFVLLYVVYEFLFYESKKPFSAFQPPRERVRRRARNTMFGMLNAALEAYLTDAMNAMTDREIQRLDQSANRIGLAYGRIVEFTEN